MTEKRSTKLPPRASSFSSASPSNNEVVQREKTIFDDFGNQSVEVVSSTLSPDPLFAEDYAIERQMAAGINIDQQVTYAQQSKFGLISSMR